MDGLTNLILGGMLIINFILFGFFFFKDLTKKQGLLIGYYLLPIVAGLYGGYIPYPIHPGKIYLCYILLSNVLVYNKYRTRLFFRNYGFHLAIFFVVLLIINMLSYLFVNEYPSLVFQSSVYLSSLFFIVFFAFNATITVDDIDKTLAKSFWFILGPIFMVCALEAFGNRELSLFFAGPVYKDFSFDRIGYYRINGIFHWPNNLANYLSCFCLLYIWRSIKSKSFLIYGIVTFFFLVLTITRTNIVACLIISILILWRKHRLYQKFLVFSFILVSMFFLYDVSKKIVEETAEQYVHNIAPRTYYLLSGLSIAAQNLPLGEGLYSTGALVEKLREKDFKGKYRLSVDEYKTTDSSYAALLIEFGFLGTVVLLTMFFWLYLKDEIYIVRYLCIFFLLTGYSNADILSMVSVESIVFFIAVGTAFSAKEIQNIHIS